MSPSPNSGVEISVPGRQDFSLDELLIPRAGAPISCGPSTRVFLFCTVRKPACARCNARTSDAFKFRQHRPSLCLELLDFGLILAHLLEKQTQPLVTFCDCCLDSCRLVAG